MLHRIYALSLLICATSACFAVTHPAPNALMGSAADARLVTIEHADTLAFDITTPPSNGGRLSQTTQTNEARTAPADAPPSADEEDATHSPIGGYGFALASIGLLALMCRR